MKKVNTPLINLLLITLIIFIPQIAPSQSIDALIPDFRVNEYLPNNQTTASIGFDKNGNCVILFKEANDYPYDTAKTYCQRYDSLFNKIGNNFRIGHDYAGGIDIAVRNDGRFIAVWSTREGYLSVTYLQKYKGFGVEDGPRVKINEGNWRLGEAKIAADTSGSFVVVVWRDYRYSELYQDIYFQRFDSSCNKLGTSIRVNDDSTNISHRNPSITMLKDGKFVVCWDDSRNNNANIYMQRFNKNGIPIGGNEIVNEHEDGIQGGGEIATNNRNYFVIAFCDIDYGYMSSYAMFYQLYDSLGNKIGNNKRVDEQSGVIKSVTKVAIREDNSIIIGWSTYNGYKNTPFAQRLNKYGVKIGTSFVLPVNINFQDSRFQRLFLRNDNIITLWTDNRTGDWDVYCNVRSFINPDSVIGIKPISTSISESFVLNQNYPNPFNPSTKIKFDIGPPLHPLLAKEGTGRSPGVVLKIYDIIGRELTTLVNQPLQSGTYEIEWHAADYPSGVYFYRLMSDDYTETKKMILLR